LPLLPSQSGSHHLTTLFINFRLSILFSLIFASILSAGDVTIAVKVDSENKSAEAKAVEKTRVHWLNIRVTNNTGSKLEGLTLKWKLYAANLQRGHDDVIVEKSGDMNISVDANGRFADITTPKVPFTYTPLHSEKSGSSRRATYKKVDESGHRYHGFHVQVMNGDTVIGEAISNESLRHLK